jgi:hypothetical protein
MIRQHHRPTGDNAMNRKILGLLASGLIIAPMAANAQITTLTYEGDFMTGTSTYLPNGGKISVL